MFNEHTLDLLFEKISEIEALCKKYGLENLRLIKPEAVDEWGKINFLSTAVDKNVSSFDLDYLQDEIEKLLNCDIKLVTDCMLREHVKDRILRDAIPYTKKSTASLIKLFNEQLLPLAKRYQEHQQKSGNKKRNSFEFFQEEGSEENTQKKNKGEDNSPSSSPRLGREQLLANKLFEEHASEIMSLSPPEKEKFIKHFCRSAGIDIDITISPAQKV
jgi:hypothetical protein